MSYSVFMKKDTFLQSIRNDFLYGLMVILPIAITFWVVNVVIDIISGPISLILGHDVHRIIGFVLSLSIIFVVGIFARHFIGKSLLAQVEKLVFKIPVVSTIYKSSKQIISSFTLSSNKNMEVVMVEFPHKGAWGVGYISNRNVENLIMEDGKNFGEGKVAVFMPTAPNPTTGYVIYVNFEDIVPLKMSFEEAMKLTVSIGAFTTKKNTESL